MVYRNEKREIYIKILIFSQYFPPDVGGGCTRITNLINGLKRNGCNFIIISAFPHYPSGNVPKELRYKFFTREERNFGTLFRVWVPGLAQDSLFKRILVHLTYLIFSLFLLPAVSDFDVILAANPNLFSFFPALMYSIVYKKNIIRNVDDLWPEVFYDLKIVRNPFLILIFNFLAKISYLIPKIIITISAGYKEVIINKYKIKPCKIHVIEVGVNKLPKIYDEVQNKNKFLVTYSGALSVGYDFNIIFNAAKRLENCANIHFLIRGRGELKAKIKNHIDKMNLHNISFNSEYLSNADLTRLLNDTSVFLLPITDSNMIEQGLPTKLFEYCSYQKPVICSSNGESAKFILKTKSGIVISDYDDIEFAKTIKYLYENPIVAKQFGTNGRKYISQHLTSQKLGVKLKGIIIKEFSL